MTLENVIVARFNIIVADAKALVDRFYPGLFVGTQYGFVEVLKENVIYIAGLFHDIGKGRGGDKFGIGSADVVALTECRYIVGTELRVVSTSSFSYVVK